VGITDFSDHRTVKNTEIKIPIVLKIASKCGFIYYLRIYFSRTQSRSFLKILESFGSLRLKRIMSTLSLLKRPSGGSPARITLASALCLAITGLSLTSTYPCFERYPVLLIGIFIYLNLGFFSSLPSLNTTGL